MRFPISISKLQKGNPVIPVLESGAEVEFIESSVADYTIGKDIAVLFLTLKFHRQHPDYLSGRLREFRGSFPVRILLFLINDENPDRIISRLTSICCANNMNMVLAFDYEEASRWLLTIYHTQDSAIDELKATNETPLEIATDALNAIGPSKREADALLGSFPTLADILLAPREVLEKSSSLRDKKINSFLAVVNEPF
jgi:DNA excision repair protein ERCC-1